jgi:hypothetical protein
MKEPPGLSPYLRQPVEPTEIKQAGMNRQDHLPRIFRALLSFL